MKLPSSFASSRSHFAGGNVNNFGADMGIQPSQIFPQGCSWRKKLGCGAVLAACVASCYIAGPECLACLADIGSSSCIDCV